ncbi:MAG: ERAP1-like C-terminal domain-containing protein, partial [Terriglobales bacterium]
FLVEPADQNAFRAWVRNQFRPMLNEIGWNAKPGDSDDVKSVRATIIHALGYHGRDPEVLRRVSELAQQYRKDPASVDPNLGGIAVELAALNGDAKLYDEYAQRMSQAKTPQELYTYMEALKHFSQPELAQRTLEMMLSPEIKGQDMFRGFFGLFDNPEKRDLTWAYFKSHWAEIQKKVGGSLGFGFGGLAGRFCSEQAKQDVQQWFAEHPDRGGPRALRQGLERLDTCVRVRNTQGPNLASWLKEHAGAASQ